MRAISILCGKVAEKVDCDKFEQETTKTSKASPHINLEGLFALLAYENEVCIQ